MAIDEVEQILVFGIVAAAGCEFSVIETEFELEQPFEFVSVIV